MSWSRRAFLQATTVGATTVPGVLVTAAERLAGREKNQVLVVLQLSGGNDGLNTLIPFEHDAYHRSRPTLAISKSRVLGLDKRAPLDVGLHPSMSGLRRLWDEGSLAVIQGVGYPNPSRSHFRSMDIWHTARTDRVDETRGWIGRALEAGPSTRAALQIGGERQPLALAGDRHVPSLQNLDFLDFLSSTRGQAMRRLMTAVHAPRRKGEVERVRGLARTTLESLEQIIEVREKKVPVDYPDSALAQRLQWAAQLISGEFPSSVFYCSQGGFDTHAQQKDTHALLLRRVSEAVAAFFDHMKQVGCERRVTLVVFSEFGRRLSENGSLGTDHGCAAPALVVSGRARGGLLGEYPSLTDLDHGDLKHKVDFRRLYATLLEDVLDLESEQILGARFDKLPLLGERA